MDDLIKQILEHSKVEHVTELEDDPIESYIPDSYLDDNGVRHAVIIDDSLDTYKRLEKVDGKWELIDNALF